MSCENGLPVWRIASSKKGKGTRDKARGLQAVLLAVLRLGDGRAVLSEVQSRLERSVAAGAVHATLERLAAKGLLVSRLGTGTPIRAGRARRFYRLRPKAVRALNEARAAVDALWNGLDFPLKGQV